MTLPAAAVRARAADIESTAGTRLRQLSIDICCQRRSSAANQPHVAAAVDRRDRQTDGRTLDRYVDPAPHTMQAASIITLLLTCIYCTCLCHKFITINL